MAKLKTSEIRKMSEKDREKKLKELKMELVKANANVQKTRSSKAREIRKMIAQILTINAELNQELKKTQ